MKRVFAACVILILLIAGSTAGYLSIHRVSSRLSSEVDQAFVLLEKFDSVSAAKHLSDGYQHWKQQKTLLGMLINHKVLDEIESLYLRAYQSVLSGSIPDSQVLTRELSSTLQRLTEAEQLSLKNIL